MPWSCTRCKRTWHPRTSTSTQESSGWTRQFSLRLRHTEVGGVTPNNQSEKEVEVEEYVRGYTQRNQSEKEVEVEEYVRDYTQRSQSEEKVEE